METDRNPPLAVIKVGGDILLSQHQKLGLAANVRDLHDLGWNIILLHGGGPQVNALQSKLGMTPNKIAGRRITSMDDLDVVKQAIVGQVNVDLVSALIKERLPAFGCHGASDALISASKRPPMIIETHSSEPIDFGEVGDVQSINTNLLRGLMKLGVIPVIATLGIDVKGNVYNINADTTVVEIAKSLQADLLLLITEVGGIYTDIKDPNSIILQADTKSLESLIKKGIITDGMIPKVEEAIKALKSGVKTIAIANAQESGLFKAIAENDIENVAATCLKL